MEEKCLLNQNAFLEHYTYNPVLKKALESVGIGLGAGGAVVGGSAMVAASTGIAGWLSSTLGISYFATAAAATAAAAALPIAIPAALGVGGFLYYKNRKNKKKIDMSTHPDDLAKEVGKIIFLPMIAKANEKLKQSPNEKEGVRRLINKKFIEWGYKQEFADEVINRWLDADDDANIQFEGYLSKISRLKDSDMYNDACLKSEIPPEQLRKFAVELAKKII